MPTSPTTTSTTTAPAPGALKELKKPGSPDSGCPTTPSPNPTTKKVDAPDSSSNPFVKTLSAEIQTTASLFTELQGTVASPYLAASWNKKRDALSALIEEDTRSLVSKTEDDGLLTTTKIITLNGILHSTAKQDCTQDSIKTVEALCDHISSTATNISKEDLETDPLKQKLHNIYVNIIRLELAKIRAAELMQKPATSGLTAALKGPSKNTFSSEIANLNSNITQWQANIVALENEIAPLETELLALAPGLAENNRYEHIIQAQQNHGNGIDTLKLHIIDATDKVISILSKIFSHLNEISHNQISIAQAQQTIKMKSELSDASATSIDTPEAVAAPLTPNDLRKSQGPQGPCSAFFRIRETVTPPSVGKSSQAAGSTSIYDTGAQSPSLLFPAAQPDNEDEDLQQEPQTCEQKREALIDKYFSTIPKFATRELIGIINELAAANTEQLFRLPTNSFKLKQWILNYQADLKEPLNINPAQLDSVLYSLYELCYLLLKAEHLAKTNRVKEDDGDMHDNRLSFEAILDDSDAEDESDDNTSSYEDDNDESYRELDHLSSTMPIGIHMSMGTGPR